jgi:fucose 4-O-acetylase-like acetyltransferase
VFLVACVILGHAFITYGDLGSWVYREPSENEAFTMVAAVFVSLGSLFAMGLFFLIAGLMTPGPLARKGPAGFLRDRAIRLGVPFVAFVLLVYPITEWIGDPEGTVFDEVRAGWGSPDAGPLWFVGVLLVYSLGYVAWRSVRPAPRGPSSELRPALLVGFAAAIALGNMVVRLWFAMNSDQFLSAHIWQWPQCLALFVLGLMCAERGWLQPVPSRVRRAGGWAALGGLAVMMAAIATATSSDPFAGGATWQAALTATCEGIVSVGLSVWMLGTFERRFDHAGPFARALGRAAFGAYVLQAPVMVVCAVAIHRLPIEPEAKFLVLAPAAIAGSFGLAWLLTRLPGVRRVL